MTVWRCELTPAATDRIKGLMGTGEFPDCITVELPEQTDVESVRERAANALMTKVTATGDTWDQEVMMALADPDAMRCTQDPDNEKT